MTTTRGTKNHHIVNSIFRNTLHSAAFADHEPGLWRAVITQALMDAASRSRKSEARRAAEDARHWLLSNSRDFEAVCDHAGYDPDYVRIRARQALERGCEWRLPAGQGWRTQARLAAQMEAHSPHQLELN
jgi:hypothetical protein